MRAPVIMKLRLTPTKGTHTYDLRAFVTSGTGVVYAGAPGTFTPAYIRVVAAGPIPAAATQRPAEVDPDIPPSELPGWVEPEPLPPLA